MISESIFEILNKKKEKKKWKKKVSYFKILFEKRQKRTP